jgi:hypothetical protein
MYGKAAKTRVAINISADCDLLAGRARGKWPPATSSAFNRKTGSRALVGPERLLEPSRLALAALVAFWDEGLIDQIASCHHRANSGYMGCPDGSMITEHHG